MPTVSGHTNSFREWKYERKSWILTNFKAQATQGKCHVGTCSVRQRNCRNLGLFALHSSWLAPNPPSSFASIGEMLFFRRKYGCCQGEKKINKMHNTCPLGQCSGFVCTVWLASQRVIVHWQHCIILPLEVCSTWGWEDIVGESARPSSSRST